jgi:hypothetical protein
VITSNKINNNNNNSAHRDVQWKGLPLTTKEAKKSQKNYTHLKYNIYLGLWEIPTEFRSHKFQKSCQCKPQNWNRSWGNQESDGHANSVQINGLPTKRKTYLKDLELSLIIYNKTRKKKFFTGFYVKYYSFFIACVHFGIHVQLLFVFLVIISGLTLEGTTHSKERT